MRRVLTVAVLIACGACRHNASPGEYLFVWAGDSAEEASDFLAVIDANPASPHYGGVVTSLPTGMIGTHPHHTEAEMSANGRYLRMDFTPGAPGCSTSLSRVNPKCLRRSAIWRDSVTRTRTSDSPTGTCSPRFNTRPTRRRRHPSTDRTHGFTGTAAPHGTVFSR